MLYCVDASGCSLSSPTGAHLINVVHTFRRSDWFINHACSLGCALWLRLPNHDGNETTQTESVAFRSHEHFPRERLATRSWMVVHEGNAQTLPSKIPRLPSRGPRKAVPVQCIRFCARVAFATVT